MTNKTYKQILDDIAKENSCASWTYYFSVNKRSERTITEATEEAARRYAKQYHLSKQIA